MRVRENVISRAAKQHGFSLIEVLFAVAISSVSILGLMAMTVISIKANQRDDRRNDSVRVASETAEVLMTAPFDTVQSCGLPPSSQGVTSPACFIADVKGKNILPDPMQSGLAVVSTPGVSYALAWTVTPLSDDLKQIVITVDYTDNAHAQKHAVTIYKHRVL